MRLIQVAQRAHDLQRAAAFYSQLLGVQPAAVYDPPGLLFFDLDGVRLLLERGAPPAVLYLEVDDVRSTVTVLQGRAGEWKWSPCRTSSSITATAPWVRSARTNGWPSSATPRGIPWAS